jgi:hypothetical protein
LNGSKEFAAESLPLILLFSPKPRILEENRRRSRIAGAEAEEVLNCRHIEIKPRVVAGLAEILSSVRPCTDTFGRKALAFLAVEHFQRVKKRDLIGVRPALGERISGRLIQVE